MAIKKKKRKLSARQIHAHRVRGGKKAARTRKANLKAKRLQEAEARIRQGMIRGPFTDNPTYNRLGQFRRPNSQRQFFSSGIQRTLNMIYNYGYTQILELVNEYIDQNGYESMAGFVEHHYFRQKEDVNYATLVDVYRTDVGRGKGKFKEREMLATRIRNFVQRLADAVHIEMRRKGKRRV